MFWSYIVLGIIAFVGGAASMYFLFISYLMDDELDEIKWRFVMGCHSEEAEMMRELFDAIKNGDYEVMESDDDSAPTTSNTTGGKDTDGDSKD